MDAIRKCYVRTIWQLHMTRDACIQYVSHMCQIDRYFSHACHIPMLLARVIDQWNKLPETVVNVNSVNTFKIKLDTFLKAEEGNW